MSDILTHVDVAFDSEGKKINFNLLWDDLILSLIFGKPNPKLYRAGGDPSY